jgi:hypothetical protein
VTKRQSAATASSCMRMMPFILAYGRWALIAGLITLCETSGGYGLTEGKQAFQRPRLRASDELREREIRKLVDSGFNALNTFLETH